MYGPELFLFMCRMGAAAVGCRMDAVLFEVHVKCFSASRRTARPAVTPSVLDGSLRRGGEPPACATHWSRRRSFGSRLTIPEGQYRIRLPAASCRPRRRVLSLLSVRFARCMLQSPPLLLAASRAAAGRVIRARFVVSRVAAAAAPARIVGPSCVPLAAPTCTCSCP